MIEFYISSKKIKGPFNLPLTMESGQTSQPPWKKDNSQFQEILIIDGAPCLVNIGNEDQDQDIAVKIIAESPNSIPQKAIKNKVIEIFSLNDNLDKLYDFLSEDPKLSPTVDHCRGLRIFKAKNPFECVISSISSANCSILRWTRSIQNIKQKWGDSYHFSSGNFHTFPTPEILSNVPEHDLEEIQRYEGEIPGNFMFKNNLQACGVGYRAKYIINTAKMVQTDINLKKLAKMKYEKAFETVLELPGVGPKVADCILLYGFGMKQAFPADVWIKRIIEFLYFSKNELKPQKVREFGMENYGDWAGYVQLYLFHYARTSGLLESLRGK